MSIEEFEKRLNEIYEGDKIVLVRAKEEVTQAEASPQPQMGCGMRDSVNDLCNHGPGNLDPMVGSTPDNDL